MASRISAEHLTLFVLSIAGWWATVPQVARMLCGPPSEQEHRRHRAAVVEAARRMASVFPEAIYGCRMSHIPKPDGFTIPQDPDDRSLWMQQMIGYLLMTDVRQRVISELPSDLSEEARAAPSKAVDSTLYCLTMLVDGIFAPLTDETDGINFDVDLVGKLVDNQTGRVLHTESLHDGDGACGWMVGWFEGDYAGVL